MKTVVTIADAANIGDPRDEVFDLHLIYAKTVMSNPNRERECAERQGYFHPSALSMCARMNVYCARSEPFKINLGVAESERFAYGHGVHDRVQTVLDEVDRVAKDQGLIWSFAREVSCDKAKNRLFLDLRIGGTTDGLIEIEKPNEWKQRGVIEIKSMKDEYWEKAKRPVEGHELQAHIYAFRFDCPIIWYWYFNKNTGKHRVFAKAFDWEILNKALTRLEMLNEHLDEGTLPDREESWYFCTYCEYRHVCDPDVTKPRKKRRNKPIPANTLLKKIKKRTFGGGKQ